MEQPEWRARTSARTSGVDLDEGDVQTAPGKWCAHYVHVGEIVNFIGRWSRNIRVYVIYSCRGNRWAWLHNQPHQIIWPGLAEKLTLNKVAGSKELTSIVLCRPRWGMGAGSGGGPWLVLSAFWPSSIDTAGRVWTSLRMQPTEEVRSSVHLFIHSVIHFEPFIG